MSLRQLLSRPLITVGRTSSLAILRPVPVLFHRPRTSLLSCPRRHYATPPPQVKESNLTVKLYQRYSDATMEKMLESLEELLDKSGDLEHEVDYGSGVLTLKLGSHGTYVINKQPPNQQIWLSSPISGPKRYDYVPERDEWVYSRDDRSLGELLNQELSNIFGQKVDLGLAQVSAQLS